MRFRLALLAAIAAGPAAAASFDCRQARAPDELAVCRSPALSMLDTEMGALWFAYSKVPMLMGSSGARRDDAQAFLGQRATCGADVGCLTPLYRARVATLRASIVQALTLVEPR